MFDALILLPAFGARTFSTVITTSVVQDLNEKIAGRCVDYPLHCTYRSRVTTSPRPLIHGVKPFAQGLEFEKIFDFEIANFCLSVVNDTAEANTDS
jgi:hypothetical protein